MVGSKENYKFDLGVRVTSFISVVLLIEMDDKTKALWNSVMVDQD